MGAPCSTQETGASFIENEVVLYDTRENICSRLKAYFTSSCVIAVHFSPCVVCRSVWKLVNIIGTRFVEMAIGISSAIPSTCLKEISRLHYFSDDLRRNWQDIPSIVSRVVLALMVETELFHWTQSHV